MAPPRFTVARFEEAAKLLEHLYEQHHADFLRRANKHRAAHRDASGRPLTVDEVARVAAGLGVSIQAASAQIEEAGAVINEEPAPVEVLLAAGIGTGTALLGSALRFVALVELPDDVFREARETETLPEVLDDAVRELQDLDLEDARARAVTAFERFAEKAGVPSGEAVGLLIRTVWEALTNAAGQIPLTA